MASFKNHQHKLTSKKLSLKTRLRFFNVFVTSIFMYNSELWVLTKKLENDIDIFHRKLLRRILKIFYPFTIRNETLYYRTNESKWSNKIKARRLRWTGHLLRLPRTTPAWRAYKFSKQRRGKIVSGNKLTWKKQINRDLSTIDSKLSLDSANIGCLAEDRDWWRNSVVNGSAVMSTNDGEQP